MPIIRIEFLGTSGIGVTVGRNPVSVLVDHSLLFDCGEGIFRELLKRKLGVPGPAAVFITHMHADHCIGLISMIYYWSFYAETGKSPPIYLPEGGKDDLLAILEATHTVNGLKRKNFVLDVTELPTDCRDPIVVRTDNGVYRIEWVRTEHGPPTYAYKINDKMVISGDTAPRGGITELLDNTEVLIHEASFPDEMADIALKIGHSYPRAVAEYTLNFKNFRPKAIYLYHTPDSAFTPDFLGEARKIFGDIYCAEEGDVVEII